MKTKTITMSLDAWQIIEDTIDEATDCGPLGEGWKSMELALAENELKQLLREAPTVEVEPTE